MAAITKINQDKLVPQLVPITPYELYIQQVKGIFDNVRYQNSSMTYIPAQFGGILGQQRALSLDVALQLTDFEVY